MEDHNLPTTSNTLSPNIDISDDINHEINLNYLKAKTTSWQQFEILYRRRTFQIFRNSVTFLNQTELFYEFDNNFLLSGIP